MHYNGTVIPSILEYKMCIRVDAAGNGGGRGTHL